MEEVCSMELGHRAGLALHTGAHDASGLVVQEIQNRSSHGWSPRAAGMKKTGL